MDRLPLVKKIHRSIPADAKLEIRKGPRSRTPTRSHVQRSLPFRSRQWNPEKGFSPSGFVVSHVSGNGRTGPYRVTERGSDARIIADVGHRFPHHGRPAEREPQLNPRTLHRQQGENHERHQPHDGHQRDTRLLRYR
jgi:hypothetical protein